MALFTRLSTSSCTKNFLNFQNCIGFIWPSLKKSTNVDAIDSFTTDLVAKKAQKWESQRNSLTTADSFSSSFSQGIAVVAKDVLNENETIHTPELGLDIRTLSQPQLDNLLLSTLEIKNKVDFLYLTKQCILWRELPSDGVLVDSLKYLSSLGQTGQINQLAEVCKIERNSVFKTYAGLAPFKGMSLWRNGSSENALQVLENGYLLNPPDSGKRILRAAFKTIAEETLELKSEAVLVRLMRAAVQIYSEHKDIFVIACVWKNSFTSDWFCDQKSAEKLFNEYPELRKLVFKRTLPLCSSFLRQHKVDAVHRMIELFLSHENMESCGNCLSLLFDYQYYRKDLRACAEIIKSSSELDFQLSEDQNEKFLRLFLNQPTFNSTRPLQQNFEYKF